jgi:hypothetical protein
VVALDHDRAGNFAVARALRDGPDIDEHRALGLLAECLARRQPEQPPARGGQDLVDGAGARRAARHHAAAATVSRQTSPAGVSS